MPLIIPKAGTFELVEKRSKFLGYCAPVKCEREARGVIEEIRAQSRDANHHVYAYGLSACNTIRFSDDGEPHGTAGMPVLTVLQKGGIIDFVCVVTRYFGGTLLGAGGLVRAYTKAAKGALESAGPEELVISKIYYVTCEYTHLDKVKYDFKQWGVEILEITYTEHCEMQVRVRDELDELFLQNNSFFNINTSFSKQEKNVL